ncbi:MAG: zinc ribbon domain-containing protein [Eubacteriales bacterium]|nr:zinc ribbon domain-containing protein [Eubacteriales bacterium]
MKNTKYFYKEAFAVIGKAGQGAANNSQTWILPLWDDANTHFTEVAALARKSEDGTPQIWGAMNDTAESNKRWDNEAGKYMAGFETDVNAVPPDGWTKWTIPAQTYMIVETTMAEYGEVFGAITNNPNINIIATMHERYPEPGNSHIVELWFPIAEGMMFCQSCAMPMTETDKFGTEANESKSLDYCCYCYSDGDFTTKQTLEEAVEGNIQFWRDGCNNDDEARTRIMEVFPKLKRWAK